MTRQALIISYPGEIGSKNYCPGVLVDVVSYKDYLKSPLGGVWYDSEIVHLAAPTVAQVKRVMDRLNSSEYTLIIFAGHGFYSAEHDSTILQLNKDEILDSIDLRENSQKRTIILDCCREVHKELLVEELRKYALANEKYSIDPVQCRVCFDDAIAQCSKGLIIAYACSKDERSGDDPSSGGYYSFSLLAACEKWIPEGLDLKKNYRTLSIVEGHDLACLNVKKLSGGLQNPEIQKARSGRYFPFAIWA